jgi:hypothetical protein
MEEITKHGQVGRAAMKADMDRKTARKYIAAGKLPSEVREPRLWRTREDPFVEHWPTIVRMLEETPALEAKTIFDDLVAKHPGLYQDGQLRTLQRHVQRWRATEGPDREVFFAQEHRPGEAGQTDFTWATELRVTIGGAVFVHMLCVFVLPFSNWQWLTVCLSESMAALRRGLQAALFRLGRAPQFHQTDNSTAATHKIVVAPAPASDGQEPTSSTKRPFNAEYLALMRHFGMTPRTIEIGESNQNGDVEASHRALKHALEQALLLHGSRDFESREAWERFAQGVAEKGNRGRRDRLGQELAVMRAVDVARLPEFTETDVTVSEWSTIRIKNCAYSVPSRLINARVHVQIFDERIVVRLGAVVQLDVERLRGDGKVRIDYRHIIWSLVQKPGAFARYRYREELFPSVVFRRAYDAIVDAGGGQASVKADLEYLRILHLAATHLEADVEAALDLLLRERRPIRADAVKLLVTAETKIYVPELEAPKVDLTVYDTLLTKAVAS